MLNFIYGLSVLALTLFSGFYPFIKKLKEGDKPFDFRSAESLACGVFLGAGLLHMLGEASNLFNNLGYHYPLAFLLCGGVFLLFLWLEHLGREYYQLPGNKNIYFALIAVVMMSIHSALSGCALGLSEEVSVSALLFFAIISHKMAESFAVAIQLIKSDLSFKAAIGFFILYALMTPFGIFIGVMVLDANMAAPSVLVPIFTALAAGTFLYLGTLHGLDKCVLVKQCCNLKYFSYVILGFVIMAVMAFFV